MFIRLYDTQVREVREFTPSPPHEVTMYHCGPTVYDFAHIGNLRAYVFADILRRTFEANGYTVKQIINITDVGHLVGDGDEGEDKMTAALRREGLPLTKEAMVRVGGRYFEVFKKNLEALNIKMPHAFPKASKHIAEDIALIEELSQKGLTYKTSDGIYFDTTKYGLERYAKFARLDLAGMQGGSRVDVGEKHAFTDFALWKFNNALGYDAPFGKGFPGWHIECSAMSRKYLGQPFDIHTGGIDHIPVHHTNEIAQSEAAYGAPLARYWMHSAHMTVNNEKMSKSLGNTYTLGDLVTKSISPMVFRYWLLTANYRTTINFTWESLKGVKTALRRIRENLLVSADQHSSRTIFKQTDVSQKYRQNVLQAINDDLNTPKVINLLNACVLDTTLSLDSKLATIAHVFDPILGLNLKEDFSSPIPNEILDLLNARQSARERKNFAESDRLRTKLRKLGYDVKDTPEGQKLSRIEP
jgi:cysteinyl-tRNA synthetase